jgi:hypothetical protein
MICGINRVGKGFGSFMFSSAPLERASPIHWRSTLFPGDHLFRLIGRFARRCGIFSGWHSSGAIGRLASSPRIDVPVNHVLGLDKGRFRGLDIVAECVFK